MIIDCHSHLGKNKNINASVGELLHSMDKANIDKALVFAGRLNAASNQYVLEQIKPHKDRLYAVAACHLEDSKDDDKYLHSLIDGKEVVAVKFYLGYEYWYPTDHRIYAMLEHMRDKNITAIFHCGDCLNTVKGAKLKYAHPLEIDDVAVDFPDQKIVIAHMAFPWVRDAAEVCYKNANVYSDISGFVYGQFGLTDYSKFKRVLEEFLSICPGKKLLFGTDWPISDQSSYVQALNNDVEDWNLNWLSDNVLDAFDLNLPRLL